MAAFDDPVFLQATIDKLNDLLDENPKGLALLLKKRRVTGFWFRSALGLLNELFGSDDNRLSAMRDQKTGRIEKFHKFGVPHIYE